MEPALMEARLRAFYAQYNPDNKQNMCVVRCAFAEIVRKFAGRERQLCAKLHKKYGAAPDFTSPSDDRGQTVETKPAPTSVSPSVYQRDFQPYPLPTSSGGALDFRSAQFDALQALHASRSRLRLPVTTAYPLDNIQKCRHLVRPSQTAYTYLDGPFMVLRRCFLERIRVLVVVRRVNSVRGTCIGFLKAFDKHMNLVLLDVSQEHIPLTTHERLLRELREGKRVSGNAIFSAANPRRNRRLFADAGGTQRDYAKQLFIRGDNVVSVSAVVASSASGADVASGRARRRPSSS
ncbi:hypothetical protein BBJ28_00009148 [Nothophytophthora sp. Chile5]|nr:hypothetical protein BBJ28_00009148 [Nothophytophthora sp. Chile5]